MIKIVDEISGERTVARVHVAKSRTIFGTWQIKFAASFGAARNYIRRRLTFTLLNIHLI